jgi:hypothetical protein
MAMGKTTETEVVEESFTQPNFDDRKFERVLHYMINKIGSRANVGKTVLNKLLFYCDSRYYEKTEKFMMGEHYMRLQYGPYSEHFDATIDVLLKENKITREIMTFEDGKVAHNKYNSLKEPDLTGLDADELATIDKVIAELGEFDKEKITAYSHEDIAYKATKEKEYIDYRLAFYRTSPFSVVGINE